MSDLNIYLLLGGKFTEAFPRPKLEYRVHEFVLLAPMEALDCLNILDTLLLAHEDCTIEFILISLSIVDVIYSEKVRQLFDAFLHQLLMLLLLSLKLLIL